MVEAVRALRANMSKLGIDIGKDQVCVIAEGASKKEALDTLITAMGQHEAITDVEAFRKAVFEREAVTSTGIGKGIAIPHVRIPEVTQPIIGVAVSPTGVDYETLDNKPVHLLVLFATPVEGNKAYLGLVAQVMSLLQDKEFYEGLIASKTVGEVHALLHA